MLHAWWADILKNVYAQSIQIAISNIFSIKK
jgi:hypothetical protein